LQGNFLASRQPWRWPETSANDIRTLLQGSKQENAMEKKNPCFPNWKARCIAHVDTGPFQRSSHREKSFPMPSVRQGPPGQAVAVQPQGVSPVAVPRQPLLHPVSQVVLVQPLTVLGVSPTKRKAIFNPGVCLGLVHCVVPRNSCNGTTGGSRAGWRGVGAAGGDSRGGA